MSRRPVRRGGQLSPPPGGRPGWFAWLGAYESAWWLILAALFALTEAMMTRAVHGHVAALRTRVAASDELHAALRRRIAATDKLVAALRRDEARP